MYGNPETTAGGRALKFYASVRIDIRKADAIKEGDEVLGNYVNIKVVKNKVAPPFKYAKVQIMYGKGISHTDELVSLAVDYDIIMKSGSWFSYKDEKIGQGKEACKKFIESHLDIQEEIEAKIREKMVEGD